MLSKKETYYPLQEIIYSVFTDLYKSVKTAEWYRNSYLKQMAAHSHSVPATYYNEQLEVATITTTLHLQAYTPSHSLWHKFLLWIGIEKALPNGTYWQFCSKKDATISLTLPLKIEDLELTAAPYDVMSALYSYGSEHFLIFP